VPWSNKEMSLRVDLTEDPIHSVIFRVDGNQDIRELDNQVVHSRSCVTDNRTVSVRAVHSYVIVGRFLIKLSPALAFKLLELFLIQSYFDI
jgi:hypothetical protein